MSYSIVGHELEVMNHEYIFIFEIFLFYIVYIYIYFKYFLTIFVI